MNEVHGAGEGEHDLWGSSWWQAAQCRGADVEIFFPLPNDQATIRRALAMCGLCPVQISCRRYAFARRERYGIWGGLTEGIREAALRKLDRALARPCDPQSGKREFTVERLMHREASPG